MNKKDSYQQLLRFIANATLFLAGIETSLYFRLKAGE